MGFEIGIFELRLSKETDAINSYIYLLVCLPIWFKREKKVSLRTTETADSLNIHDIQDSLVIKVSI